MFSKSAKTSTPADLKLHPKTVSPSVISADTKIVGSVESQGDLQVDGTIEGDVNSRSAASLPPRRLTLIMPPKSRIWWRAISWPGWFVRPG